MSLSKPALLRAGALSLLLGTGWASRLPAESPSDLPSPPQDGAAQPAPPPAPPNLPPGAAPRDATSSAALEALVSPVALYPDPLLALILPASTVPNDIAAAAGYLVQYGDASQIDRQPWDPSVRGLAHYPALLSWLADNASWTQALGAAFLGSPAEVMAAVQRVRSRALASGLLASTAQQQVVTSDQGIQILPAQPQAIYVPSYDPAVLAADPSMAASIDFGPACAVGDWLSFGIEWDTGSLWMGGAGTWRSAGGWRRQSARPPDTHRWQPPSSVPVRGGAPLARSAPLPRPVRPGTAPVVPRSAPNPSTGPQDRPRWNAAAAGATQPSSLAPATRPAPPAAATQAAASQPTEPRQAEPPRASRTEPRESRSEPGRSAAPASTPANREPSK